MERRKDMPAAGTNIHDDVSRELVSEDTSKRR